MIDLQKLKELSADATRMPWQADVSDSYGAWWEISVGVPPSAIAHQMLCRDVELCVEMRNSIDALIEAIEAAQSVFSEAHIQELAVCHTQYFRFLELTDK